MGASSNAAPISNCSPPVARMPGCTICNCANKKNGKRPWNLPETLPCRLASVKRNERWEHEVDKLLVSNEWRERNAWRDRRGLKPPGSKKKAPTGLHGEGIT